MKYPNTFVEQKFRSSVEKALKRVKGILDATRQPRVPHEVEEHHQYDDKFALVEFLVNAGVAAEINALDRMGLDSGKLDTLARWVHDESETIILRFEAEDQCSFIKESIVAVDSESDDDDDDDENEDETNIKPKYLGNQKVNVVTKVKEHHWKMKVTHRLSVFQKNNPEQCLELQSRTAASVVVTSGGSATKITTRQPPSPIPEYTLHDPIDVDLTWLIQQLPPDEDMFPTSRFHIDRTNEACRTPRRNPEADQAIEFSQRIGIWSRTVSEFMVSRIEKTILGHHSPFVPADVEEFGSSESGEKSKPIPIGSFATLVGMHKHREINGTKVQLMEYFPDENVYLVEACHPTEELDQLTVGPENINVLSSSDVVEEYEGFSFRELTDDTIFAPVVPLLEQGKPLGSSDLEDFLTEQDLNLDTALKQLSTAFPPGEISKHLISAVEATTFVLCKHMKRVAKQVIEGLDYVEHMLSRQLVQAIGKEVDSKDIDEFLRFHYLKLFGSSYAPQPFTYAVRRPNRSLDGMLSIESSDGHSSKSEPIYTWVRQLPSSDRSSTFLPISSATTIEVFGETYIHGWMQNHFESSDPTAFHLAARARQFSSFVLIIGTMMGPAMLEPKEAIILRNKDEVLIPLLTNSFPSEIDFNKAISSLSPEQQEFAKAFRAVQFESSIFGVCVIPLRPQFERVLGLPDGSLTKEFQLTQDLLTLFADYEIPSDILSLEDEPSSPSTTAEMIQCVKDHVKSVMDVVHVEEKKKADEDFSNSLHATSHHAETQRTLDELHKKGVLLNRVRLAGEPIWQAGDNGLSVPNLVSPAVVDDDLCASPLSTKGEHGVEAGADLMSVPMIFDEHLQRHDSEKAMRLATISTGHKWTRKRNENLLSSAKTRHLFPSTISVEKKKALDLLDAMSRSGSLAIELSELHVIITVSHHLENDLIGTVIQDNINPIDKLEKSALLIASTIHQKPPERLLANHQDMKRLTTSFPALIEDLSEAPV